MKYFLLNEQDIYELFLDVEMAIFDLKEKIQHQIDDKLLDPYDDFREED